MTLGAFPRVSCPLCSVLWSFLVGLVSRELWRDGSRRFPGLALQQLCQEILFRGRLEKTPADSGAPLFRGGRSWQEGPAVPSGHVLLLRRVSAEPGRGGAEGPIHPCLHPSLASSWF